jgi:hypothetical protein
MFKKLIILILFYSILNSVFSKSFFSFIFGASKFISLLSYNFASSLTGSPAFSAVENYLLDLILYLHLFVAYIHYNQFGY